MVMYIYVILGISFVILILLGVVLTKVALRLSHIISELYEIPYLPVSTFPFKTGDLLLFSSQRKFFDPLHILITDCAITHVGMVVRNPNNGLLRIWELTLSKNTPHMIRLSNLRCRLQQYKGTVLVRQLQYENQNDTVCVDEERMYEHVKKVLREDQVHPKKYRTRFYFNTYDRRTSEYMCLHPPLPIQKSPGEDNDWICTDILSDTYHAMGIFDKVDMSLWPRDFYSEKENLPLSKGWGFAEEVRLKQDMTTHLVCEE